MQKVSGQFKYPKDEGKVFPHGFDFGGYWNHPDGHTRSQWYCQFSQLGENSWECSYLGENWEVVTEVPSGHGETPLEAFNSLVRVFIMANLGEPTPALKELLPILRSYFNEEGSIPQGIQDDIWVENLPQEMERVNE